MIPALFNAFILCGVMGLSCSIRAQEVPPAATLTTAAIRDPSVGDRKAFTVTFPSGWQFQGTVIARLGYGLPSPVFRAYSPDGLSEIRLLPAFNWEVMKGRKSGWEGLGVPPEHIYLHKALTAAEFLDRYLRTLNGVHVMGPVDVGTAYQGQVDELLRQLNANNAKTRERGVTNTGNTAALHIETVNGTFTIEQRLRARVICNLWSKPVGGNSGNCSARLDVVRAPAGQFDALIALVDNHRLTNAKHDDEWLSAVLADMRIHGERLPFDPPHSNRAALAMLYREANDLGLTGEFGRRTANSREFVEHVYRPIRMHAIRDNGDWADFALEPRPTVIDESLEQPVVKHNWSDASGHWYQTRYPNADPNGALPGKWVAAMPDDDAANRNDDRKAGGTPQPQ